MGATESKIQSIDFIILIEPIYRLSEAGHGGLKAQGPSVPRRDRGHASFRPRRGALLRESADALRTAQEARGIPRRAAHRASAEARHAYGSGRGDRGAFARDAADRRAGARACALAPRPARRPIAR